MFHIDRVAKSPPNRPATDLWLKVDEDDPTNHEYVQVYGAELAKVLARTMLDSGG
jgi:hypothetical protein